MSSPSSTSSPPPAEPAIRSRLRGIWQHLSNVAEARCATEGWAAGKIGPGIDRGTLAGLEAVRILARKDQDELEWALDELAQVIGELHNG